MANDRALFTAEVILSVFSDPETPPVGTLCLFPQADGKLYLKNSNGDIYPVGADVGVGSDVRTLGGALDNQVAVWVDNSTIEGLAGFTYDGASETLSVPTTGTIALGSNPVVDFRNNRIELRSIGAVDTATANAIKDSLSFSFDEITGSLSPTQIQGYDAGNTTEFLRRDGTFQEVTVEVFPSGMVTPFAGSAAPTGWLLCNGQALPTATYPNLFAVIGYTYNPEGTEGGATFNLPDLRQRVPVGVGTGFALGDTGGTQTHTLTVDEMPAHSHTTQPHSHDVIEPNNGQGHRHGITLPPDNGTGGPQGFEETDNASPITLNTDFATTGITIDSATVTVNNTGGGQAHNNMQPYVVLNYIIKE